MAATQTVHQFGTPHNFDSETTGNLTPRHGVVTLFGYGIKVFVNRGHLILEDGIGSVRCETRLARVGHGLRRLVVIGADGMISLAALRWLAHQDAAFVMLDRDGSVLATTGPVAPSDARLRRAQALAHHSGAALQIVRELICQKLHGQERIVNQTLNNPKAALMILQFRAGANAAKTIEAVRQFESLAAQAYWTAWQSVPINFPRSDLRRVPDHWKTFGTRTSLLTGSPRLATNPPNAILNYLYAVLESEARLAIAALGLDPGIGVLHFDAVRRDSLACDLMEAVRPKVDAFVLDWITQEPLRRDWFFEKRDGNCRLMGSFAVRLSETAPTWARAVAPLAEWISRVLSSTIAKPSRRRYSATKLTQGRRREAKGGPAGLPPGPAPRPLALCRICGISIESGHKYCASCALTGAKENLTEAAKAGRVATHSPEAEAKRTATQLRHGAESKAWRPSDLPEWLNEETYRQKVQPRLSGITVPAICSALGISEPYATDIRAGRRIPHPRHWLRLARLVGFSPNA